MNWNIFQNLRNVILKQSDSIEESGSFVWQLVLSLFSVYFIVYVMVIKGIKVKYTFKFKNILQTDYFN